VADSGIYASGVMTPKDVELALKRGSSGFLWVTWHCHLDSNLREKRKFFIGLGYSSRQGAKNAKFGNLFCLFAAFASLREIILILVAGAHAKFFVLHTSSQETQNSHFY
jgi:hypothetical protein